MIILPRLQEEYQENPVKMPINVTVQTLT